MKVFGQFLRARLSKHFKQTTRRCLKNGQCLPVGTDKRSINVPEQWGFGPALPLVSWVTYFYFFWAPLPCCNPSSHEREEFTACDLLTVWSLSPAHHSRNQQRRQGQRRSEQERKAITKSHTAYSLIPAPHALYLSLAGLFLVQKGIYSSLSSDSILSHWQRSSELEHYYATTIALFRRAMIR